MVEELVLQPAEEALHRGVVWRAALPGHRADDAVALAYRDPSGPSVVDAPVGMEDRGFPVAFLGAGGHQAPVGEFGARPRPYRPGDELAIEAVEHRREVALAAGQPELRMARAARRRRPGGRDGRQADQRIGQDRPETIRFAQNARYANGVSADTQTPKRAVLMPRNNYP